MNYRRTLETLYNMMPDFQNVGADAYKPGLERVDEFSALLGRPSDRFRAVHIAGTNGKGSVSHMMAAVLQESGLRVGLYTSPHLRDFRERIRVDGETIPEEAVVEFAERHMETMKAIGLSFFEATMCMAFDWFARQGVDVAVVEAGLGGRLDSTNIITPLVSVITNIGLDHQQFLGGTPEEIAGEKAGIIKRGVPVVIGEHGAETDGVFIRKAAEAGAPILFAQDIYKCTDARKEECGQTFTIERTATPGASGGESKSRADEHSGVADRERGLASGENDPSRAVAKQSGPASGKYGPVCEAEDCGVTGNENAAKFTERLRGLAELRWSTCAESGSKFDVTVDLLGDYQAKNVVTLLAALRVFCASMPADLRCVLPGSCAGSALPSESPASVAGDILSESPLPGGVLDIIQRALPTAAVATGLRGRWEVIGHHPLVVADTGHNAHGMRMVAEQLRASEYDRLYIIIGVAADKDLAAILPLLPADAHYIFTAPGVARAMPAGKLAAHAAEYGLAGEIVDRVPDALARARELASPGDMIFIGGSNFTVAEVI